MSEDAKKKDEGEAKPKKSKKLLIIILAVVLLAGAGGGAGWFFVIKPKQDAAAADEEEEHKPAPKDKAKVKTFANLEPFTVNLADEGGERFVQVSVVLEVADAKVSADLTAQMPAVRNSVLMLLSSKYAKDLLTVPGKEQLAEEIAVAAGRELGWEPADDEEEKPTRRKAKADPHEAEAKTASESKPKDDAKSEAKGESKAEAKGAEKKPKKRKKRRADPNPIEAVHFAQFIVQ